MTTDALGNPIEIGQRYGYSQQSSGFVTIVVGTIEKINGTFQDFCTSV